MAHLLHRLLETEMERPLANPIPAGLHSLTPQLVVDGAAEAIEFYKKAFGAEETERSLDPDGKRIWHATVRIGNSAFYVNDTIAEMGGKPVTANLWLYVNGIDAAFKRAVDAGATVTMPLTDTFWGDRTGSVADRWGNTWNIAQRMKDLTPAQMTEAQDQFVASQAKTRR